MSKKKNHYHKQAMKKSFLSGLGEMALTAETKGDMSKTGQEFLKDVAGLVIGGAVGANIDSRLAMILGAGATLTGYFKGNKYIQVLGIGLMAAPIITKEAPAVKGLDGLEGVKERLMAYRDIWLQKLHLKKKGTPTSGLGEGDMQFFDFQEPVNGALAAGADDLAALDDIESQLAESAMEFQGHAMGESSENLLGDGEALLGDNEAIFGELEERLY